MSPVAAHLLRRTARSLRENLYLNAVAAGVIAASLMLVGTFLLALINVRSVVDTWNRDIHISAYFDEGVDIERRFVIKDRVEAIAGVAEVRYVSEADAGVYLTEKLPELSGVLEELGDEVLPASLEITLDDSHTSPEAIAAIGGQIISPDFEEVDYGQEWVQRFSSFLTLLQLLGAAMGVLIFAAGVFLVGNTMHLVTYTRRAELETMKLVGATWWFLAVPFLLEGLVQGLVGSGAALVALALLHSLLDSRLGDYMQLAILGDGLAFLPGGWAFLLVLGGVLLGSCGSLLSVHRFWRASP